MKIQPTEPVKPRVETAEPQRSPTTPSPAPGAAERRDRVEISAAALEASRRAAAADPTGLAPEPVPADAPKRLELVAARLEAGFYDRPDVLDAVVARLLASGDLQGGESTSE